MINRRIIRGKVLQQLFAYKICEGANIELAQEKIIEAFTIDLNADEVQDSKKLENYSKRTLLYFEEYIKSNVQPEIGSTVPQEIAKVFAETIFSYNQHTKSDQTRILKTMIEDTEKLFNYYLLTISLLVEAADKLWSNKKIDKLEGNQIIEMLRNNGQINQLLIKHNISWADNQDVIGELIKILASDTEISKIVDVPNTFEVDQQNALYIIKSVFFKNARFNDYFESLDYSWDDDKASVKDLVLSTLKSMNEQGGLEIPVISKNWLDDREFMKDLYIVTMEKDRYFSELIGSKLKNWDISRLTKTDTIIMKMCLAEMINCHNIPVKVSINEYLELAKRFSTPKSSELINGVLDVITQELLSEGIIKKSGRGLIDNK